MRLYIAGPMRGLPLFNFPAFDEAASRLRAAGHVVFSPAERDREVGFNEHVDPDVALANFSLEEALRHDFRTILDCDGIVLLPGWHLSSGARAERFVAEKTGRKVYTYTPERSFQEPIIEAPPWDGDPRPQPVKVVTSG